MQLQTVADSCGQFRTSCGRVADSFGHLPFHIKNKVKCWYFLEFGESHGSVCCTRAGESSQKHTRAATGNQKADQAMSCMQNLGSGSCSVYFVLATTDKAAKSSQKQARAARCDQKTEEPWDSDFDSLVCVGHTSRGSKGQPAPGKGAARSELKTDQTATCMLNFRTHSSSV